MKPDDHYSMTFRPQGFDDRPVAVRIRRLLRYMLRSLHLRCVTIEPQQQRVTDDDIELK